jgi:hypothetical protein
MSDPVVAASGSGSSLANVGAAVKGVFLAHPLGLTAFGGALLGIGAYYAMDRYLTKRRERKGEQAEAEPAAA